MQQNVFFPLKNGKISNHFEISWKSIHNGLIIAFIIKLDLVKVCMYHKNGFIFNSTLEILTFIV